MVYTHTYEIEFDGVVTHGEIAFDGSKAYFKSDGVEEMSSLQHGKVQQFFELLGQTNALCGEGIKKIEVIKKV